MTIDLKWGLPFVMPVVLLFFIQFMCWLAGTEITEPGVVVFLSTVFGMIAGGFIAVLMAEQNIRWNVTIGRKSDG